MTAPRRVGILGGTFDPIHCGHLDAGAAAQTALDLGELLVLPSNIPPHRPQPEASGYHRFAMVALAIAGRRGWRALDLELREDGRSYTSDSLHRLHHQGFDAQELYFVTGADAFLEIATWKHYPAVLNLAHFAVISRRGTPVGELPARLPALADRMRTMDPAVSFQADRGAAGRSEDRPLQESGVERREAGFAGRSDDRPPLGESGVGHAFQGVPASEPIPTQETVIFLIDVPTANVSATAIRGALANRQPIAGMVPPAVRQHIEQHALYQDVTAATGSGGGS
ncbi:MAG: nicotinate-nucleotide adenylyltransferase [Acidobacteriota bacterium]